MSTQEKNVWTTKNLWKYDFRIFLIQKPSKLKNFSVWSSNHLSPTPNSNVLEIIINFNLTWLALITFSMWQMLCSHTKAYLCLLFSFHIKNTYVRNNFYLNQQMRISNDVINFTKEQKHNVFLEIPFFSVWLHQSESKRRH